MQYSDSSETSLKTIILSVIDWSRFFFSKWVLLLAVIIVGSISGFLIHKMMPKLYAAETTFVLEEGNETNPLLSSLGLGSKSRGLFTSVDNIMWLYQSKVMLREVLLTRTKINGKEDLLINFFINENGILEDYPQYKSIKFTDTSNLGKDHNALLTASIGRIKKNYLVVDKISKTENGVSVRVISKVDVFSKAFNEVLVRTVNDYYVNSKVGKLQGEVDNVSKKLEAVKKELDQNMYGVAATIEEIPYPNPVIQTQTVPTKQKAIDVQVNTVIYTQLTQTLETLKLELSKSTPLINILDTPILPLPLDGLSRKTLMILGAAISFMLILIVLFCIRYYKMIMLSK